MARHRPSDGALRVIVADEDPFARSVLEDAGMIVIAEARDGHEAIELGVHHRPDVVVMHVVMPGLDGVLSTRRIVSALPEQLVIMLTSAGEDELGLLALRAGAVGSSRRSWTSTPSHARWRESAPARRRSRAR